MVWGPFFYNLINCLNNAQGMHIIYNCRQVNWTYKVIKLRTEIWRLFQRYFITIKASRGKGHSFIICKESQNLILYYFTWQYFKGRNITGKPVVLSTSPRKTHSNYFRSTVKPCFMNTQLICLPHFYGQFALSLGNNVLLLFSLNSFRLFLSPCLCRYCLLPPQSLYVWGLTVIVVNCALSL